jgi:hypothetical protein
MASDVSIKQWKLKVSGAILRENSCQLEFEQLNFSKKKEKKIIGDIRTGD